MGWKEGLTCLVGTCWWSMGWSREFSQHVIKNANLNGTYREKKISVEKKVQITRETFEGTLKAAKVSGTSFLGPRPFHLYFSFFSGSS